MPFVKNALAEAISRRKYISLDLDGVFYRLTQEILDTYAIAVAQAAIDCGCPVSEKRGVEIAWDSWNTHRYSLQIFVDRYGVDLEELHTRYHAHCDTSIIHIDKRLPSRFKKLKMPYGILTHGGREWSGRVLDYLNLGSFFPDETTITALEDVGYQRKTESTAPFVHVIKKEGHCPKMMVMADDSKESLKFAKKAGMMTVFITRGKYVNLRKLPQVDYTARDLSELLEAATGMHPHKLARPRLRTLQARRHMLSAAWR